jgi:DnaK suppressor protein
MQPDAPDQEEPRDEGDESLRDLLLDTRMRLTSASASQAQQMERALERLREGKYGICVECHGPIELKRLEAVPWTVRCLECQESAEFDARDHSPSM